MAAAGIAEVFAHGLADHFAAGIEHAGHDGRVFVGDKAFIQRRAVQHRHARNADVVLDGDAFTDELAGRRAFDRTLPLPGTVTVRIAGRAITPTARVFRRQGRRVHGGDGIVVVNELAHRGGEEIHVAPIQIEE